MEGKDDELRTVLHLAAQQRDERLVDLLIQNNASVNESDNGGTSAFYYAVEKGDRVSAMKLGRVWK